MISQADFVTHVSEPTNPETLNHPYDDITYFVGRYRCPLRTSIRNTLFLANYEEALEPLTGPVKMLSFLHVGNDEPADVSMYARTCTSLEFLGHISSVSAVFGVVDQLPKLEKLTISIGRLQGLYEPENSRYISVNRSVKKLKICIDKEYYNSLLHVECNKSKKRDADCAADKCMSLMQYSMAWLAKSILFCAMGSFPNLEGLEVDMLDNGFLDQTVNCLTQCCPINKKLFLEEAQAEASNARRKIMQNPIGAEGTRVRPEIYH